MTGYGLTPAEVELMEKDASLPDVVNPVLLNQAIEQVSAAIVVPIAAKLDILAQQSSPFFSASTVELAAGSPPYQLLGMHPGRKRAVITASAGAYIGSRADVMGGGGGYGLSAGGSLTVESTSDVWVRTPVATTVSVWAEYVEV